MGNLPLEAILEILHEQLIVHTLIPPAMTEENHDNNATR